jgi:hypothetical protein
MRCVRRSLPAVGNVACVLLVFLYLYAIMGINLFYNIKQGDAGITRHANFATWATAMLTEFRYRAALRMY